MSTDNLEIFRQMAFVSSVLAGFAIAVAIELIALAKKGPVAFAAIAAFLTSSIISVAATFSFVIVMTSMIGPEGSTQPSDEWIIRFIGGIGVLPFNRLFPIHCRNWVGRLAAFQAPWDHHICLRSVSVGVGYLHSEEPHNLVVT